MGDDTEPRLQRLRPVNDNIGQDGGPSAAETWNKVDAVALTLARIIGRRMAREDFERLTAANDNNWPKVSGETEDGADTD